MKSLATIVLLLAVGFTPSFAAAQEFCANENELCSFDGNREVRYGANGVFVSKTLSGGTPCTNAVFGDPIPGVVKQCYLMGSTPAPASQSWNFCADEWGMCSFTGAQNVRYGANGVFVSKTLSGGTPCTNAVFGDPIPGVVKQCFLPVQSASPGSVLTPAPDDPVLVAEDIIDQPRDLYGPYYVGSQTSYYLDRNQKLAQVSNSASNTKLDIWNAKDYTVQRVSTPNRHMVAMLVYTPAGKLSEVVFSSPSTGPVYARQGVASRIKFTYDSRGNVVEQADCNYSNRCLSTKYTYDAYNRLIAMAEPDGLRTSVERNSSGGPTRIIRGGVVVWDAWTQPKVKAFWTGQFKWWEAVMAMWHYLDIPVVAYTGVGAIATVEGVGGYVFYLGATSGNLTEAAILCPTGILLMGAPVALGYFLGDALWMEKTITTGTLVPEYAVVYDNFATWEDLRQHDDSQGCEPYFTEEFGWLDTCSEPAVQEVAFRPAPAPISPPVPGPPAVPPPCLYWWSNDPEGGTGIWVPCGQQPPVPPGGGGGNEGGA